MNVLYCALIYISVHCGVMLSLFYKRLCNKYLDSQR